MVRSTQTIEAALGDLFAELDAERFDTLAERLEDEVELADELTGEWLRGQERVGAYLRVQRDIVTEVRSTLSSVHSSWLADGLGLVTFIVHQAYRLDGDPRSETLSGSALFRFEASAWRLRLFHLGEPSAAEESSGDVDVRAGAGGTGTSLGDSVKRVRAARGLSLRALGERTGLSPSLLSQVERGLSDPSLSSLRRVADALGVSVADLLGEGRHEAGGRVVRRTARSRVITPDIGALHELLSSEQGQLDARIVTIDPGVTGIDHAAHAGIEFLLVLEGPLRLTLADEEAILHVGDAGTVDPSIRHQVLATGQGPARFLWISVAEER